MKSIITFFVIFFYAFSLQAQLKPKGSDVAQDNDELSQQQLRDFHERCREIVEEFQRYLPIIADKSRSEFDRQAAIDAAEALFSEGSTIQISSKNSEKPITRRIGSYLINLKTTEKYSQIKITFYDAAKVSDFIKKPDGNYEGNATIFQKFIGFDAKGKPIYQDLTQKKISTSLNLENDVFYNEKKWRVFLGNITVEETKEVEKP